MCISTMFEQESDIETLMNISYFKNINKDIYGNIAFFTCFIENFNGEFKRWIEHVFQYIFNKHALQLSHNKQHEVIFLPCRTYFVCNRAMTGYTSSNKSKYTNRWHRKIFRSIRVTTCITKVNIRFKPDCLGKMSAIYKQICK